MHGVFLQQLLMTLNVAEVTKSHQSRPRWDDRELFAMLRRSERPCRGPEDGDAWTC